MEKKKIGGVEYSCVDPSYFERRGLKRYARVWHLWALGVGAVISGDFFGWNFGLAAGGFGGLLLANVIITLMYLGLCFSIAEMTAALPHTGGAYSFARCAMGPIGGYVTGLAENMEYILTPAVIVVGIGGYLGAIFGTPASFDPVWWLLAYVVFVGLNIAGVEISFRFSVVITVLALIILGVFFIGAVPLFSWDNLFNIDPSPGRSVWLPKGWTGVLGALPFAIWFYLAIEELPLAAEESHTPVRDLPKGIVWGIGTLVLTAFLTLFLNTGVEPGAAGLSASNEPLFEGFRSIFGDGVGTRLLSLIAVAGLVASFHTIIFAYGRQIYSLSRAGYFPPIFSLTHGTRKTPHISLIVGAVMGYTVALAIHYMGPESPVGAVLLNMAVFGAVISYGLQMISYVLLRLRFPHIHRPFVSPFGLVGAVGALVIALVTLVALFLADPVYQKVVVGAALWYALGLLYFFAYGRKRLVLAPEEEFAVSARGESASLL